MHVPSGVDIAAWFRLNHAERLHRFQGCEGLDLVRDGRDYCYVWLMAYVDLDLNAYSLLDVRTALDGVETRDFLLVWNAGCDWHQHPITTGAPTEAHRDRLRAGMTWMADTIESVEYG